MKLSEHFSKEEFACNHCGEVKVDDLLIEILEDVRKHFGKPIRINSGYRCLIHNTMIGSKPTSQHTKGTASDIVIKGINPSEVADYLEKEHPSRFGIGRYETFTHIDVRKDRARWG